jgi:hypothetical protein
VVILAAAWLLTRPSSQSPSDFSPGTSHAAVLVPVAANPSSGSCREQWKVVLAGRVWWINGFGVRTSTGEPDNSWPPPTGAIHGALHVDNKFGDATFKAQGHTLGMVHTPTNAKPPDCGVS